MRFFVISEDDLSKEGGGVTHIFETFEPLRQRGHEILLFASGKGKSKRHSHIAIHYVFNPFAGVLGVLSFNIFLFCSLLYHLIRCRPDVIYTRQLTYSCIPLLLAFFFRIKHCLEVNGVLYDELQLLSVSRFRLLLVHLFSFINYRFSDVISVTVKETADRISQLYKVEPERISILPCNAANHHLFKPAHLQHLRQELDLSSQDFILGFVGFLYSWHGIDLLIKSLPNIVAAIPNARLLVVGDGIEFDTLNTLAGDLNMQPHITFTGVVAYHQVPQYIQAFDVGICFFKPSRPIPGIPMKMYEYMACAIPVIASDISGYGPVLATEKAGISVNTDNPDDVSAAVIQLYKNPQLRMEMGANGRKAVEREFNWQRVSARVEKFITNIVYPQ